MAAVHFRFESDEALNQALASEGPGRHRGRANYTTITPVQQISEVVTG